MRRRYTVTALALLVGIFCWACDRDDEPDDEPLPLEQRPDGLPPEGPFEGSHDPSEPVAAADFHDTLVDSFCLAYDECRNEHIKAALFGTISVSAMMVASHKDDHGTAGRIQRVLNEMERTGDEIATREQCATVFSFTFADGGLTAADIERAIDDETVHYDPEAAAQCMAQFGQPFDLCTEFYQLVDTADLDQATESFMTHQADLAQHFEACNQAFDGRLEEGDPCRHDYECQNAACQRAPDAEVGTCSTEVDMDGVVPGTQGGGLVPGAQPGSGARPPMHRTEDEVEIVPVE